MELYIVRYNAAEAATRKENTRIDIVWILESVSGDEFESDMLENVSSSR